MNSRSALVIARRARHKRPPELPWLTSRCHIQPTDWILLDKEAWCDLIAGEMALWSKFEHMLLRSVYLNRPELILVIGQRLDLPHIQALPLGRGDVANLVERLRWYSLPAAVRGFLVDDHWWIVDEIEPEPEPDETNEPIDHMRIVA